MPVAAQDLITSRSFFSDPTSKVTYGEVRQQTFTPYEQFFNAGFDEGAFWIKLRLDPSSEELVLSVKPPYIDDIDVYYDGVLMYRVVNGGNRFGSSAETTALPYAFSLPPSNQAREVYLRFKSAHSYQILIDASPLAEFNKKDRMEKLIYTGYTTFSLTLALWLLIMWLIDRNIVVGAFATQQFLGFVHSFITAGFAQFFFADTPSEADAINHLRSLVIVTYPLVGLLANKLLLAETGLTKQYAVATNFLIAASLLVITMFFLGYPGILKWNAMLVLVITIFFWLSAVFGLTSGYAFNTAQKFQRLSLRIYYSVNLVIWLVAILPLLGVWNLGPIAFHSLFVYNVLSGLMLFFLLQVRYKYRLESELASKSALEAQANAERNQREELGMMLTMLSHEIKTPLSVLKLVVDDRVTGSELEGHANRAISNISSIINRCLQLDKLDSEQIKIEPSRFNVANVINAVLRDLEVVASSRLELRGDPKLDFTTDPIIFSILASNLIDNALKYSPIDSTIRVRFFHSNKGSKTGLLLLVANRVGVLGRPDSAYVFKKYYRNTAATKISGSGLGLFLVSRLVKILGGNIKYLSRKDHVVFVLRIPN